MADAPKRILVSPDGTHWPEDAVTRYEGEVAYVREDVAEQGNPAGNPAWRAYALMAWPKLSSFGQTKEVLDDEGKPVLDSDGVPKTFWNSFNITDMNKRAIQTADTLYAAELAATERHRAAIAKAEGEADD